VGIIEISTNESHKTNRSGFVLNLKAKKFRISKLLG